jgi:hypothetical protein
MRSGVNFINILRADPNSTKNSQVISVFLCFWDLRAACKTLVKSIPEVNFINIKRTNFSYKCHVLEAFSSYMYVEKRHLYEKFVCKMLMKLTPGGKEILKKMN